MTHTFTLIRLFRHRINPIIGVLCSWFYAIVVWYCLFRFKYIIIHRIYIYHIGICTKITSGCWVVINSMCVCARHFYEASGRTMANKYKLSRNTWFILRGRMVLGSGHCCCLYIEPPTHSICLCVNVCVCDLLL